MNIIIEKKNNTYTVISMDPDFFLRKTKKHRSIRAALWDMHHMCQKDYYKERSYYRSFSIVYNVVNGEVLPDKEKKQLLCISRASGVIPIRISPESVVEEL